MTTTVTCRELATILRPRGQGGFDCSLARRLIQCRERELIEIVAKLPEELVIAGGYAGVSDLVGGVEREF